MFHRVTVIGTATGTETDPDSPDGPDEDGYPMAYHHAAARAGE
ncbi:hypothetical protein Htur_4473 (plasmid) [Haloterrigena turkmenica DSM 5511]|uniref:Uncharacterized protein n=1 Tax=Haloterrigena turkmenica (strain ATCC 51198 / DSM 5511 / JCM 9101 / NCIMB 13204 / VKM B-1734 / 4k) TaxID=543526 RepID=D2S1N7_HALTV|nr:hypothetical protein [Haloterrigena turkmenica]ADB63284.1 hypothetical protein Htur_4473 [Haloterrigena turkmenica DSM 5511]